MINLKMDEQPQVCLIDFGFVDKFYKNSQLEHFDEGEQVDTFQGNLLFSSFDQMNFKKTTRKDDLIQLFYLMTYLINENSLVGCLENIDDESNDI